MYDTLISPATLQQLLIDRPPVIVDCRFSLADTAAGERAYRKAHIPGAHYAHLDHDLSGPVEPGVSGRHPLPDRERFARQLKDWGLSADSQLVCYDDSSGAIASRLWWLANWCGHAHCAVLDGGLTAWIQAGGTLSTDPPSSTKGNFRIGASRMQTVNIEQLLAGQLQLLDAREAARYRGEHEPIDPVAGHIPGARNQPFTHNLDGDGRFRSPKALAALFASHLQAAGDRPLVHYCGSGVTATHNILAMRHAGLPATALYAGSFSEWISRDRDTCPVASNGT